jgi:hypothetical protein
VVGSVRSRGRVTDTIDLNPTDERAVFFGLGLGMVGLVGSVRQQVCVNVEYIPPATFQYAADRQDLPLRVRTGEQAAVGQTTAQSACRDRQ